MFRGYLDGIKSVFQYLNQTLNQTLYQSLYQNDGQYSRMKGNIPEWWTQVQNQGCKALNVEIAKFQY